MSPSLTSEINELKLTYQEIIEGCSFSKKGFFIKHLCDLEQIEITRKYFEFYNKYIEDGIPIEKDKLEFLKTTEEWTDKDEADILAYRQTISDNEKLVNTMIPAQRPMIKKIIEKHKEELVGLLIRRRNAVGTTAEELASRDLSYFSAYLSLFSDRKCEQPVFSSWGEFEEVKNSDEYLQEIDSIFDKFREQNVRKISVMPFFLNSFSYAKERVIDFLGKPLCQLTNYQSHLFSLGTRNLSILSQSKGSPPEYYENVSADDILKWYDTQYSILLTKSKSSS